jgi:hypothetical protein
VWFARVKACGFFMFLYKLIYVYKIVCAQLFNIYFIEYIQHCILYKNDRLPTPKNTFYN